jgi:GNAT superfamily N-acetyltransferase
MKMTKDMAAFRAVAQAKLDAVFAERYAAILGPMQAIHARKVAEAQRVIESGVTSLLLAPEAKRRGVAEKALAEHVMLRAKRQASQIGALEAERQDAQAEIAAARSPAELDRIIAAHGS